LNVPYREAVGAIILIYIAVSTRPDISMVLGVVSQFMVNHKKSHWNAVKHIYSYLRGTTGLKLMLGRVDDINLQPLVGFTDVNWGGIEQDHRSTSGFCVFLHGECISWGSKKQRAVTLSTMEAEYMSLSLLTTELLWLRSLLHELGLTQEGPTVVMENNQSCIKLANNGSFAVKSKHIAIKYRFVYERIKDKLITLRYCPSSDMIADIFTKAQSRLTFWKFRNKLGLISAKE